MCNQILLALPPMSSHAPLSDRPLFVLSLAHRDAMAQRFSAMDVPAVVARRREGLIRRFIMSESYALLLDARGAVIDTTATLKDIGAIVQAHGARIIVMNDRGDSDALDDFVAAGFDVYLPGDCNDAELRAAIAISAGLSRDYEDQAGRNRTSAQRRDEVTGLPGEAAALAMLHARLAESATAILMIEPTDLDRVNDQAGEAAGDELLRIVAGHIDRFARDEWGPEALVTRLKGARFALIAPKGTSAEQIRAETQALVDALGTPIMLAGTSWQVGCRTAVVSAATGTRPSDLLRDAARTLGHDSQAAPNVTIGTAISEGEVRVFYQPQFAIDGDIMAGVEALARWDHPELGHLGAAPLVTAARRAGVLPELTAHIHDIALSDMGDWPAELAHVKLSLNVTAEDLARSGFSARFLNRLARWNVAPERVTVEITEDAMVRDIVQASDALGELKTAGVGIAIDDFGAGYAGLGYLRDLPIDYLKIDSGMTKDLVGSERDRAVIHAVFELARSLGLATIAEGVETSEQLALLAKEGCTFYQGFLRSGAVRPERLAEFL